MSKYEKIKDKSDEHFKRLTGVRKTTFRKMVELVVTHENERKKISGRPLKLSYEDQVLMTLEYNREYRTYFLKFSPNLIKTIKYTVYSVDYAISNL